MKTTSWSAIVRYTCEMYPTPTRVTLFAVMVSFLETTRVFKVLLKFVNQVIYIQCPAWPRETDATVTSHTRFAQGRRVIRGSVRDPHHGSGRGCIYIGRRWDRAESYHLRVIHHSKTVHLAGSWTRFAVEQEIYVQKCKWQFCTSTCMVYLLSQCFVLCLSVCARQTMKLSVIREGLTRLLRR